MSNFLYDSDKEDFNIDLTPLIDVIFMLIIFFVLTTSFITTGIKAELPKSEHSSSITDSEYLITGFDENGKLMLDRSPCTIEELEQAILENPDREINLYTDRNTPFEKVIRIIDLAKTHRNGRIIITTVNDGEQSGR